MHERVHKNGLEKPYSWYLVVSQAFYKEWAEISMECVAMVNHERVIYWVINYRKKWNKCLKNMTAGMVPWYDLTMPWLKFEKVWLMSSCTPFINRTITEEVPSFRKGKSPRLKGNPNFRPSLSFSFFPTINILPQMQRVLIWHFSGPFTIFRGLCAFSRH